MIELSLLGTPELRRSGETSEAVLVQPRRLAVLAYLVASRGAFQRRDRLLLLFWGEQPETRARASLRQALYFIRRSLGDDVLITRGDDEVGVSPLAIRADVVELELALAEGDAQRALDLYRGDFLADFNIDGAPEFERWATERRREIRRSIVGAAWMLADAAMTAGSRDAAIQFAGRAAVLADYAESDVRRAMRTIAAAGDRSAALELYELLRDRLATDLEVEPEAETMSLAGELRAATDIVPPVELVAAGVVRPSVLDAARPSVGSAVATPVRSRLTRGTVAALAAVVAIVVVAGAFALYSGRARGANAGTANRVAVFPFTVRSREGQSGYLREGAATLLGLALDGAGRLRAVDANAVLSASPPSIDLDAATRLASSLGAGQFVLGEIQDANPRLNITATLYDATGHPQTRATATGEESHLFELVDSLARVLAANAMTDSTVRLANAAATSTRSLAAFKSFLAGEANMRGGHYREAVAALQAAVAADSTFGLAYYRLALAREWTGGEISSDSAAALAEHFASHLPDRDRMLLAARRAVVRRDLVEGERLARDVLASYPTDADAWLQLGEVLFHLGPNVGRSIDEAREPFLTVLRFRPNDLAARVHLTRIAAHFRDTRHLDEWSAPDAWLADASEIGAFELAAMRAVVLGDDRARSAVGAAMNRANDLTVTSAVWRLSLYSGDPDAARTIAIQRNNAGFDLRETVLRASIAGGHIAPVHLADEAMARGNASLVALMLAMPSAPALPALARRAHDELSRSIGIQSSPSAEMALIAARLLEARYPDSALVLKSAIVLPAEALRTVHAITEAIRVLATQPAAAFEAVAPRNLEEPTTTFMDLDDIVASIRAEALHGLGRDAEAIAWLRSIGMNSSGVGASVALATRRAAELEDARGAHDVAARYRSQFATMWRTCDPELRPLVDEARSGK